VNGGRSRPHKLPVGLQRHFHTIRLRLVHGRLT
jgi:hypothetical protein